jgi:hypothetical protein
MRVAYFPNQASLNSGPVLTAALQACEKMGLTTAANDMTADAAMIWSVLWHGRMQANQAVYQHFRSLNKPVIIIEVGVLHRNQTWKIALNNITSAGYYGHQQDLDWDRPSKLGIKLQTKTLNHGRVLVAGQHNRSLQLEGVDQEAWYVQKINEVADGRSVIVRPHPRCALDRARFPKNITWEQPRKLVNTYDSFDMHWEFDSVINYNSGPGIQAVIAGVPAVVDQTSLAYNIEDREQWLVEICHTEYTVEEIQTGIWLKRLKINQH